MKKLPPQIPFELHAALEVFLRELDSHIRFFQEKLEELQTQEGIAEDAAEYSGRRAVDKISKRFHLIRGGASFLGLRDLQDVATLGEDMFSLGHSEEEQRRSLENLIAVLDEERRLLNPSR